MRFLRKKCVETGNHRVFCRFTAAFEHVGFGRSAVADQRFDYRRGNLSSHTWECVESGLVEIGNSNALARSLASGCAPRLCHGGRVSKTLLVTHAG